MLFKEAKVRWMVRCRRCGYASHAVSSSLKEASAAFNAQGFAQGTDGSWYCGSCIRRIKMDEQSVRERYATFARLLYRRLEDEPARELGVLTALVELNRLENAGIPHKELVAIVKQAVQDEKEDI